jgi:recombination protein RecR
MTMAATGYSAVVDRLITALGRLPGIGARSAERLAHHLLKCPPEEALELAEAIRAAKEQIRHCQVCFHLTEADQPICAICRDPKRDHSIVCVVEQSRDLIALEKARAFHGVYHVLLGRLAPLSGMGPEQLTIEALAARIGAGTIRELIMATNPNLEGDGTALLIADRLGGSGVRITRLARGLASGSTLEFANRDMLADALTGRQPF